MLSAQQQLTRVLLNGQAGQTQTAVDEEPPTAAASRGPTRSDPVALEEGSDADDALDGEIGEAR